MIATYTQVGRAEAWLSAQRGKRPTFVCVLGFTETGLIEGISAAGATPESRRYTAIADAEYLILGSKAKYALPGLVAGASPVLITKAVVDSLQIPVQLFNAGLPIEQPVAAISLGGRVAQCLSSGQALPLVVVEHLLAQGYYWGARLGREADYLILSECVVGGTTTALAVLTGLGFAAAGKVNSSHPRCNHAQKQKLVEAGLISLPVGASPLQVVAAVGDPMQIVVAGMAIAANQHCPVMLGGGTQMLAVYALARAITNEDLDQVVIGTTRWVAEDVTGDTVGLAELVGGVPLLATQLNFHESQFEQLRAYEQGHVKEGVGAGACAIAAHLYKNWGQRELVRAIEFQMAQKLGGAKNSP
jgi:uncharacterized protein (TIGR00303 family)